MIFFKYSFVISINPIRFNIFKDVFQTAGLKNLPTLFKGFQLKFNGYKGGDYRQLQPINQPIISVSFTHAAIVKTAKTLNYPFVVIFEDDAYPCSDIVNKLKTYLTNIPDDATMLKFGRLNIFPIHKSVFTNACKNNQKYIAGISTYGSHAYMIFSKYYDQYLEIFEQYIICDHQPFNSSKQNYLTRENLFMQINQTNDTIGKFKRTLNRQI